MYPGVAKAWHIHQRQTDWWYVMGSLKVALYDTREDSPTRGKLMEFLMGDRNPACLKIPPGVAHGCRALERSHVAVTPGIAFGRNAEGYLRFSYSASVERIREGLRRLGAFLATRR